MLFDTCTFCEAIGTTYRRRPQQQRRRKTMDTRTAKRPAAEPPAIGPVDEFLDAPLAEETELLAFALRIS